MLRLFLDITMNVGYSTTLLSWCYTQRYMRWSMFIIKKIDGLKHIEEFASSLYYRDGLIVTVAVIARELGIQFVSADESARYVMIWSIYIDHCLTQETGAILP